jgi:hypothetical protein
VSKRSLQDADLNADQSFLGSSFKGTYSYKLLILLVPDERIELPTNGLQSGWSPVSAATEVLTERE